VTAAARTYVLVASWREGASLVAIDALRRAQDAFEVLGPPAPRPRS
jgi:hypothetical protein